MKTNTRPRYWLGVNVGNRELFTAVSTEAAITYGTEVKHYGCIIGPFRTKRGAVFMRDHGRNNPHCQSVNQAEKIAAGFAWDLVLGKWVRTRACARNAEVAS